MKKKIMKLKAATFAMEVVTAGFAVLDLVVAAYIQWPEVCPLPLTLLALIGALSCTAVAGVIAKMMMNEVDEIEAEARNRALVAKIDRRL